MENELLESKSVNSQVLGGDADLWGLMVVAVERARGGQV